MILLLLLTLLLNLSAKILLRRFVTCKLLIIFLRNRLFISMEFSAIEISQDI